MRGTDVRDVWGRVWRLVWAIEIGIALAIVIALVLPQRSMNGWGGGAFGGANPALVGAGACGFTLAIYALLGALARRRVQRVVRLPRARLLPSRG